MSRVSQEHAAGNRARVVAAASSLFRQKGLEGVGIREVMAEAGLTHGGFAGQFGSKEMLAGEACAHAFGAVEQAWSAAGLNHGNNGDDAPGRLRRLAAFYFKSRPPGQSCPMSTLSGDAARAAAGNPVRAAFTAGLQRLATLVAGETHDEKALAVLAAMVGAVVLRRASDDADLAARIEAAVLRLAAG